MTKKDYYEALGVGRNANADEIKKAYRKMALRYHPDKNPGDTAAEQKFKEINEAHEVLKDGQKKAAYDQFGHSAFQGGQGGRNPFGGGGGGFEGFDFGSDGGAFSDIFSEFFGDVAGARGGRSATHQSRGSDLRYNMNVSLEEAFAGKNAQISFTAATRCETCDGSGSKDGNIITCGVCRGSGRVRSRQGFFALERPCAECKGKGHVIKNLCSSCKGQGKVRKERTLSVNIPQGVEDGTRVRLAGEGEPGHGGGQAGDLYIFVSILPHSIFKREGNELHCEVPIKMTMAALGGEIEVPAIEGKKLKLSIPTGTQSNDKFRIKEKGMSRLKSTARGDLYVHVQVETPVKLTTKQVDLLQEFEKEENENSNPKCDSFFKKVKNLFS